MTKLIAVFLGSAIASSIAVRAHDAGAANARHHPSACGAVNNSSAFAFQSSGVKNTNAGALDLYCGVNDTSTFPHGSIATVNAHAYQPDSAAASGAQACVSYYATNGGTCGALTSNLTTGNVTISPSTSVWTNASYAADFAYLLFKAGPNAVLKGFYTST